MKLFIFILLLSIQLITNAATKVVFLNGIDNSPEDAVNSERKIATILNDAGYGGKFDIINNAEHRYNAKNTDATELFNGDLTELFKQAKISAHALAMARAINLNASTISPEYITKLGFLYDAGMRQNIDPITGSPADDALMHIYATVADIVRYVNKEISNNNKIIFVAHSQGNYHAEAANAFLLYSKNASEKNIYKDSVRYVGVASVAASTPNNRYLSAVEDTALALHDQQTTLVSPFQTLIRNVLLCAYTATRDTCMRNLKDLFPVSHSFLGVYTSDEINTWSGYKLKDILVGYINESFNELAATPSASISFSSSADAVSKGWAVSPSVTFVAGRNGGTAAKFAGTSNPGSIRIPNNEGIKFTDEGTFDFWMRIDSNIGAGAADNLPTTTNWHMALVAKSSDTDGGAFIASQGGLNRLAVTDSTFSGNCSYPLGAAPGRVLGQWYRVTSTISSATGTNTYVGGQLVESCPLRRPSFANMNAQDLYIGKFSNGWFPLNGAIQDVKIYSKALSQAEIQALP